MDKSESPYQAPEGEPNVGRTASEIWNGITVGGFAAVAVGGICLLTPMGETEVHGPWPWTVGEVIDDALLWLTIILLNGGFLAIIVGTIGWLVSRAFRR
jgi:hypothetical protein